MAKAAPKKEEENKKPASKNKGRPVRGAVAAKPIVEKTTPEEESQEVKETSFTPRHVVVEVEEETPESKEEKELTATETIAAQNVAESITTENPSELVTVRKGVTSMRLFFAALLTGVLLGVLIFGGMVFYDTYGGNLHLGSFVPNQPTPTVAVSPTPTEKPLDVSAYSVQVLNGSGVAGSAGVVADLLTKDGFKNVAAGNASEFGFEETEVQMKGSLPKSLFAKIQEALPEYSVVEVTSLAADSKYDVIITVGTEKKSQ